MIDVHCHILPGVDDGARDWDTALRMCAMAENDGIEHIVATPHANDDYVYEREIHEATLDELRSRHLGRLTFSLGCDFHLSFDNYRDFLRTPQKYTIGGGRYLLVEFADTVIPPNTKDLLATIRSTGYVPVITHPERNPVLQRNPKPVVEWAHQGAVVQVTANSLTGRWGDRALKTARFLFEQQAVHVIATDAHNPEGRPPVLSQARSVISGWYGEECARALVTENPSAIVESRELPHAITPIV